MSKQASFFADPEDASEIHIWILAALPGVRALETDGAPQGPWGLVDAHTAIAGNQTVYLVPPWARERIVTRQGPSGGFVLSVAGSPVIEYAPSVLYKEENRVTAGRLYWGFNGTADRDGLRQLDRLLRWIRGHSIPTPFDRRFRVFRRAAENGRLLDYGFGIVRPSPPWDEIGRGKLR